MFHGRGSAQASGSSAALSACAAPQGWGDSGAPQLSDISGSLQQCMSSADVLRGTSDDAARSCLPGILGLGGEMLKVRARFFIQALTADFQV